MSVTDLLVVIFLAPFALVAGWALLYGIVFLLALLYEVFLK